MTPSRKKRLTYFLVSAVVVLILGKFIFNSLQKNTIYFFSPTDLYLNSENPKGLIRVGGLVKKGSVQENKNEATYTFVVTDLKNDIYVEYKHNGIPRNLQTHKVESSIRYRLVNAYKPDKTGDWTVTINRGSKKLNTLNFKVIKK